MKWLVTILSITFLLLFSECNKDELNFEYCDQCAINEWVGNYEGDGEFFNSVDGSSITENKVSLHIESPFENTLSVSLKMERPGSVSIFYSMEIQGEKKNDQHYAFFSGISKTLDMQLYKSGNEYKITGTAKTLKNPAPDSVITDKSLTFRVFKTIAK